MARLAGPSSLDAGRGSRADAVNLGLATGLLEANCGSRLTQKVVGRGHEQGQLSSAAEQRFCKPSVVGSNPTAGSIPKQLKINNLQGILHF